MAYCKLTYGFKSFFVSKWVHDSDFFEVALLLVPLFWMIVYTFVLCEPVARMTNQFSLFNDEVGRCDWYLLSIEMQRMYMVFLSNTQHPLKMQCYANITCERETIKKVIQFIDNFKFKHSHFCFQF